MKYRGKGFWRIVAIVLGISLGGGAATAGEPGQRAVPDFKVILTDDGGKSFTNLDPQKSTEALRAMIRSLQGTPVKTLVYEVAAGSQVMFYPTKVGSVWGWREAEGAQEPAWKTRLPINRAAARNGLDAVRTAGEAAKAIGLYFMPGYRINDAHFAREPLRNVLTGEFWMRNRDRYTFGSSPVPGDNNYRYLFDFSHPEVRQHCLAVIFEVIDRYADIMDGIQLDFMRHPLFFPAGTAQKNAGLMTELVTAVRRKLDETGRKQGRVLALSLRTPAALATCRQAGLNLDEWLRTGLVDIVIPSPSITLAHDLPVEDFVKAAAGKASIFPALYPRTQFHWPLTPAPHQEDYASAAGLEPGEAQFRGAVLNYLALGAGGFELYNFNLPPERVSQEVFKAIAEPRRGDSVFAITPAYWAEREELFEYRKQVPFILRPGKTVEVSLPVGLDLSAEEARQGKVVALRLGLRGKGVLSGRLVLAVNGQEIYQGDIAPLATKVTGKAARPSRLQPPTPEYYFQQTIDADEARAFRVGRNRLAVRWEGPAEAGEVLVVETQLAVMEKGP